MKKFLEIIKNKWLIKGTTTLLLVLIVIACYIGLNILVDKIEIEDLDFTEKKLYSLSDETKNKIKDLDEEVTIQLINTSSSYSYLEEYAKKYEVASDKINVEIISDLSSRTDLKSKYDLTDTDMLIVVKKGENEKTITESDLYTYDYSTYKTIDLTEEAITNAIVELSINDKPKIYVLTGKAQYNPESYLYTVTSELTEDSNDVEYLDILTTGTVPEDCDCLVITTQKQDLNELERDEILKYIQNGGKIMVLTSQNIFEVDTPNLDQVFAEYGFSIDYGVVFEQDTSKMLSNAPEYAISEVSASFMSDINMSMKFLAIDAGNIEFKDDETLEDLGVTYETLATTSESSFIRTDFSTSSYTKTDADSEEGSYIIGALVTKEISDDVTSELIIYSSEISATDMQIPISSQYYSYCISLYNNKDVILNSISYLTERTDTITIRKDDESETYTVTDHENAVIKTIIFTTPVCIIIIGLFIWIIRKRRV